MSEQSGFPFGEVSDGAGLDIDAIFGGASGGSGSVNPFEYRRSSLAYSALTYSALKYRLIVPCRGPGG